MWLVHAHTSGENINDTLNGKTSDTQEQQRTDKFVDISTKARLSGLID